MIEKILTVLQRQAEITADLLGIALSSYPESYRKARRSLLEGPKPFPEDWAELYRRRQIFYALLNKLKRQGLIEKKESKHSAPWRITKAGSAWLARLRKRKKTSAQTLPKKRYKATAGGALTLVVFDIPERDRHKRAWLRFCLVGFGFTMLQRSVWIGRGRLSEEFLRDLRNYGLLSCVHIISIHKSGTITTAP